jgi:hypothetical protein
VTVTLFVRKVFLMRISIFLSLLLVVLHASPVRSQGVAYGSLTNFDTVNDTGHECHGFEIELEDCNSTDISRTYNYNHYGVPFITESLANPGHPVCRVRWESRKNPDGSWAAYTAVPSGPISPTNGHQFTNPSVNFGGEHFGVSYRIPPSTVRYFWLSDDGNGNLVRDGQVQVAVPTFVYLPPQAALPARIQVAIEPPEPPEVPVAEFGPALWVKEIRTSTHNNREIHLRDLVSDDPEDPDDLNWQNGEPDEVEVEWQLLQTEFARPGQGMGRLVGGDENLDNGDEVITRRYEFFEYVGPLDTESLEAKADRVGADDLHGDGVKTINGLEVDLSTVIVVGEYKGAQMAAVAPEASVALIDHLGEGFVGEAFAPRAVVIQGKAAFTVVTEGILPEGMEFDSVTGILSGTPLEAGEFHFSVIATEEGAPPAAKNYLFITHLSHDDLLPGSIVDTVASPPEAGTTNGDGGFAPGAEVTVSATSSPGFVFVEWVDDGASVSIDPNYTFTIDVNHSLVARFKPRSLGARPDATIGIRLKSQRGDGVYSLSGAGQTLRQVIKGRGRASFYFQIQNDSDGEDPVRIKGTPGDRHFRVTYLDFGSVP